MKRVEVELILARALFGHMTAFSDLDQFIKEGKTTLAQLIEAEHDFVKDQIEAIDAIYKLLLSIDKVKEPTLEDVKLVSVESSNLDKIGYHKDSQTLFVEFKGGTIYSYPEVDQDTYNLLLEAESVGKIFGIIKKSKTNFKRVK